MPTNKTYFSEAHIIRVAEQMHAISKEYEQLFIDFGSQLFMDIRNLHDAAEIMALCINRSEETIAAFRKHFPDTSIIACSKGCHHCCSFAIDCPPLVAADIARHIRSTLSVDEQQLLHLKMKHNIAQRTTSLQRARCPFLDTANSCSIYEKRPLACRSFSSRDAADCERSVSDCSNITQHPLLHRVYMAATTALLLHAKTHGQFHEQVSFIPALLAALHGEDILTSKYQHTTTN